jgi:hypothetical protein
MFSARTSVDGPNRHRADNIAIATEPPLPRRVAQDEDRLAAEVLPFPGDEQATERRLQTECREEIPGHHVIDELRRRSTVREPGQLVVKPEDVGEDIRRFAVVDQRRERELMAETGVIGRERCRHDDDAVRVGDWQRTEDAIEQTEDAGVGAGAEGEGQHGRHDEQRRSREMTNREPDVLPEVHDVSDRR